MKYPFQYLASALLIAGLGLSVSGCKEDSIIDANTVPNPGGIFSGPSIDTFTVWAKTVYDDSIVTSLTPTASDVVHGIGTMNDPFMGRTNAGIYMQILPEKNNFAFSSNAPTIDSAFVVLPYTLYAYGDSTAAAPTQSYSVYRVTGDLSRDVSYYSKTQTAYDAANPVSDAVTVDLNNLKKTVRVLNADRKAHLRIRLKDAFKNELVSAAASANSTADFIAAIKGLYIAPTDTNNTTGKSLAYYFLTGAADYERASVQFFYHEGSNTDSVKTGFFNFVSATCAHYNYIARKYSPQALAYINSPAQSDSIVFLQNEPGASIDLKFPYIKNFPTAIINKAEVIITQVTLGADGNAGTFYEPRRVFPVGIDASGKSYLVLDRSPIEETALDPFVGGFRTEYSLSGGIKVARYVLNLPREVQRAIVNKTELLHLRINGAQGFPGAYRLIAGGGKPSMMKVSLSVTYSKL